MTLSIKELKEHLIQKEGYTIDPKHSQLMDLKMLVDNMMFVRNEAPPATGSGSYSGTTCNGHQVATDYSISLGDINKLDIKGCSCNTVADKTAYCRSRTYSCSCNSNTPTCDCDTRTGSCNCNNDIPTCDCNSRTLSCYCHSRTQEDFCTCDNRTPETCECKSRTYEYHCACNQDQSCGCVMRKDSDCNRHSYCSCQDRVGGECSCYSRTNSTCSCQSRTSVLHCECNLRTPTPCDCQSRNPSCGTVSYSDCICQSRASSCGSRNTTSCTCNGRCSCNYEKRFE